MFIIVVLIKGKKRQVVQYLIQALGLKLIPVSRLSACR